MASDVPAFVTSVPPAPVVALPVDSTMLAEREAPVPPAQPTVVIATPAVPPAVALQPTGPAQELDAEAPAVAAPTPPAELSAQMPPHETDVLSAAWESAISGVEAGPSAPLSQDLPVVGDAVAADTIAEEPSSIVSTVAASPPETQTRREDETTDFLLEPMRLPDKRRASRPSRNQSPPRKPNKNSPISCSRSNGSCSLRTWNRRRKS